MADALPGETSLDTKSKLEPLVLSQARPSARSLLQARAEVQRDHDLQGLFQQFHPQLAQAFENPGQRNLVIEAFADQITARLTGLWGGDLAEALESARYLADEFAQLGEGIHIVSSETGKVIAKLDEKDLYQPAPVLRESGELVQPLPRIEPGMEAMIVSWVFEKGREERILAILTERAHQTALLREEGDRRLWIATRSGRARLAQSLGEDHPKTLLDRTGGTAGAFLRHFDLVLTPPEGCRGQRYHLEATMALRVNDPLTTNLSYDRLGSMRGVLAQSWVRVLAKELAATWHHSLPLGARPVDISDFTPQMLRTCETWVADPEVMLQFLRILPKATILPANGAPTLGLKGKVGILVLPEKFDLRNREVFGRWEVCASLDVDVYIPDWSVLTPVDVRGVVPHAEVVS